MTNDWVKVKVICSHSKSKNDCEGCGMNTTKVGFTWQLHNRIPCTNASGGIVHYIEVK